MKWLRYAAISDDLLTLESLDWSSIRMFSCCRSFMHYSTNILTSHVVVLFSSYHVIKKEKDLVKHHLFRQSEVLPAPPCPLIHSFSQLSFTYYPHSCGLEPLGPCLVHFVFWKWRFYGDRTPTPSLLSSCGFTSRATLLHHCVTVRSPSTYSKENRNQGNCGI